MNLKSNDNESKCPGYVPPVNFKLSLKTPGKSRQSRDLTLVTEHPVPAGLADALHGAVAEPVDAARKTDALLAELASP